MKTSLLRFFCVLIICISSRVVCSPIEKEGLSLNSAQCLGLDMQVQKLSEDILTVTEKRNDYHMSYGAIAPKDTLSRYSIGLNFRSLKLHLTLNVDIKCETENYTGLGGHGKLLTSKDGIEITLEYSSSTPAYSRATKRITALLNWITWPFKSFKDKTVDAYNLLADKATKGLHWITWPLISFKNKIVESVYSYLKPKIENPIIVIEAVLEVIWMPVKPVLQAGQWLCEFMIAVKRQVEVKTEDFLKTYPIVLDYIEACQMIGGHVTSTLAQWPWDWKDSIEYIGFSWVISYFMFNLIKFSAMDERKLQRIARRQENGRDTPQITDSKVKLE